MYLFPCQGLHHISGGIIWRHPHVSGDVQGISNAYEERSQRQNGNPDRNGGKGDVQPSKQPHDKVSRVAHKYHVETDYLTTYTSDQDCPWTYVWLGFSGRRVKGILNSIGLNQDSPVFTCEPEQHLEQFVLDMLEHNYGTAIDLYRREAMLMLFFSALAQSKRSSMADHSENAYVAQVIRYIQDCYHEPLRVEDMARYVGLNRSYLSTLFKKYTGLSPIKYLQTFRMTRAAHLLSLTQLPVTAIAYSCGYQETEFFHKIFKQHTGLSPKQYRIQEQSKTVENREKIYGK